MAGLVEFGKLYGQFLNMNIIESSRQFGIDLDRPVVGGVDPCLQQPIARVFVDRDLRHHMARAVAAGYQRILESPVDKPHLYHALHEESAAPQPGLATNLVSFGQRLEKRGSVLPPQEILVAETSPFIRRSLIRILG